MTKLPIKIILHSPLGNPTLLQRFVESCLADGVELIAVFGCGSEDVHDLVDDAIVGDGSEEGRFIATTWHNDETLSDVIEFATVFGKSECIIEQVRL